MNGAAPRLVMFDVDGTLADSQGAIVAAMAAAFSELGLPVPERGAVLAVVGLSLEQAMARLAPDCAGPLRARLVAAYRRAYFDARRAGAAVPLFPGARAVLRRLAGRADVLLGVATGKSRRGLDALIAAHGLEGLFVTRQVADDHPSKPHPSMLLAAMAETGATPATTAMVGDTAYDMDMAQAAGVAGIGVSWGYHPVCELRRARAVIDDFAALPAVLERIWSEDA